ncbi:hypothetical protein [Gordonia shandongensis]|uniref:hypothetical protein n=1 Tax=Gordonia shandongensis TaxID=376351 RepID=UPI0003F83C33|nr:hypothetical protein [Gordonia shandongensis]
MDADGTLRVAVSGTAGVGVATMVRALHRRFGVAATARPDDADADADLLVRVIGAQERGPDRVLLDRCRRRGGPPVVVIAGKADARPTADRLARAAADRLGLPVTPVSGLLAGVDLDDAQAAALRRWADRGRDAGRGFGVPVIAAMFPDGATDPADQRMRADVLSSVGRTGLVAAMRALVDSPELDAAGLSAHLRGISGIDALIPAVRAAVPAIVERRRVLALAEVRLSAARGHRREDAERWLAGAVGTGAR